MQLSIIITSWDTKQLLRACLHPTRSFSPVDSFETIVGDNASKDFPSDIAEREPLQVILVTSAVNMGHAVVTIKIKLKKGR
jgi:GT2 family glycosyltransferase